ncbi:MAG TPA: tyrosine-type recombinase/integrase [Thermoanaerobaculia bacterium]|jgi:integrase|nr:tyrosine-type recombinase/integrase [Thermoanaerobaculia bacterium]
MRIKLTEKVIAGLHTTQDQEDILHTQTPGGGIRISKEGRKVFFILFRPPGSRKLTRYSVGYHPSGRLGPGKGRPLPQMTLKEFENAYAIFRGELAQGRDPRKKGEQQSTPGMEEESEKVEPDAVPEKLRKLLPRGYYRGSIGALLVDYFTRHAPTSLAPKTFQGYLATAQTHFGSFLQLRAHDLEAVTEALRAKLSQLTTDAPQMTRHVKKVLSAAYGYGMAHWQGIKRNPCLEIKVTVKKNKRQRWFADDELVTILAALPKLKDRRVADAYLLMLASACRPNEAAFVEAPEILRMGEDRVWRLPEHKSKNKRELLFPLTGPIGEIINRRYLEAGGRGPLFWEYVPTKDYPEELADGNEELRKLTGITDMRPHDFRRTCRTHLTSLGVRMEVAEAVLAHAEGEIQATYNLWTYWPERKQALALWHTKLAELMARASSLAA